MAAKHGVSGELALLFAARAAMCLRCHSTHTSCTETANFWTESAQRLANRFAHVVRRLASLPMSSVCSLRLDIVLFLNVSLRL